MTIAIIFGGYSFEHEISIVSAITMKKVLNNTKLVFIFVDKRKNFYLIPLDEMVTQTFSSDKYLKFDKLSISLGGLYSKGLFNSKKIEFDVALNLIHGSDGEDGKIISLFNFFDIPIISPSIEASVMSYNKYLTKLYAVGCGVKTIDYKYFNKTNIIKEEVKYPSIIKPCRLGSSIGITIVKNADNLDYSLDSAFEFDDEIIIEPFYPQIKEYNLAGCKIDNEFVFSIVEEPQKEDFLDFEKKYLDFNRDSKISSANIDNELLDKIQDNFKKIYNTMFDGSLIRCDFFVIDNEVYLNEINPIPGSMANYLFDNFEEIIHKLAKSLPKKQFIDIRYEYINKLNNSK